jgi:hypothetical protein
LIPQRRADTRPPLFPILAHGAKGVSMGFFIDKNNRRKSPVVLAAFCAALLDLVVFGVLYALLIVVVTVAFAAVVHIAFKGIPKKPTH